MHTLNIDGDSEDIITSSSHIDTIGGEESTKIPPWKFVFVIYFCVCGGAYGFEVAIQQGYPGYTLMLLVVVPLLWAIPIALITAELGTALPSNEGAFLWIQKAFGQEVSFVASIIYWFSYSVDTALYPALFYAYFKEFNEPLFSQTVFIILIPLTATAIIVIMNCLGIEIIGTLSVILLVIQLSPVFVIFGMSLYFGHVDPRDWIKLPPGDPLSKENLQSLGLCLQVMIWSYSGYDSVGSIVEQLQHSSKNLRKCLFGACSVATLTYFTVIVGSIGINKNYSKWTEGSLATMGETLGGPILKYAIIVSAMIASLGTFNALMFPTSQQLKSLGGPNYLNISLLSWVHPRFQTPWVAIVINGIVCGLGGMLPFIFLLQLNNIFYGILIIFICISVVRLRYSAEGKYVKRPFKVADHNGMVILAIFWPVVICVYLITDAVMGDWRLGVVTVGVALFLLMVYFGCSYRKKNDQHKTWGGGEDEDEEELIRDAEEMDDVLKAERSTVILKKKVQKGGIDLDRYSEESSE